MCFISQPVAVRNENENDLVNFIDEREGKNEAERGWFEVAIVEVDF